MKGHRDEVVIVQNRTAEEKHPFAHPALPYRKVFWEDWKQELEHHLYMPSVTGMESKYAVVSFFSKHFGIDTKAYTNIIHPTSIISDTVTMGVGCFIEPGSIITSFATLGNWVSVNRGVTIGHHTSIGDFTSLNPGVHVAGHCTIGQRTQIGIGSVVFNGVTIGNRCIIGCGSVVTKDIPDGMIAWGNPCKVVKPVDAS